MKPKPRHRSLVSLSEALWYPFCPRILVVEG